MCGEVNWPCFPSFAAPRLQEEERQIFLPFMPLDVAVLFHLPF